MTFGKRMQEFRLKKGYTRADVASMLGIGNVTVEKWELNQRRPNLDKSKMLAQLYGVTVDELVGETLFNPDQKLKAAEVARILASGDEKEKKQIEVKLQSAGFSHFGKQIVIVHPIPPPMGFFTTCRDLR